LTLPAWPDPGEEDVGRPVLGLRRGQREGRDEPAAARQSVQPLILAHVVVGRQRRGPQVGGPGDMGLVPGAATVLGVGEPHVRAQGGIARSVVAQVIPGHADGAVGDAEPRITSGSRNSERLPAS
jgi:hypothetical protein